MRAAAGGRAHATERESVVARAISRSVGVSPLSCIPHSSSRTDAEWVRPTLSGALPFWRSYSVSCYSYSYSVMCVLYKYLLLRGSGYLLP